MSQQKFAIAKPKNLVGQCDIDLSLALYKSVGLQLPRAFYKLLEHTGSGLIWLPVAIATFLAPSASQDMHTLAANLLLGLLIDLAYVGLLKGAIRRPRPVYNNASDFLLVIKVDQYSFPSGHAARSGFTLLPLTSGGSVYKIRSDVRVHPAQQGLLQGRYVHQHCLQGDVPCYLCLHVAT